MYLKRVNEEFERRILSSRGIGYFESDIKVYAKMENGEPIFRGAQILLSLMNDDEVQFNIASGEFTHIENGRL